ncbi:MAG: aldehyde dehydrogenase family protein [bacterium]|nr:aldehyde dehydrogenase family protein [bacterium]
MNPTTLKNYLARLDYGPALESDAKAKAWLDQHGRTFRHFINGIWSASWDDAYLTVTDPSTREALAKVAKGGVEDVNDAMNAARNAFPAWSKLPEHERAKYLYAIARAIAKNARLFEVLESMNNGKTFRETHNIDIPLVIRHFYYHAGQAQIRHHEHPEQEPGGVVGQIIPWNFPLLMLAWKIAPAIAVGNTVVLKPAESTPLTALLFAEILRDEVRLPPGVVNIVTGDGSTGELIVKHPTPWAIEFTGSTEVGRKIRKETAGSGKHLTLELGGKSPFVVFADADMDAAVEGVVDAIWFNQGQVCCAGSRLLVEESIYEEFTRRLKVRASKLRIGPPLDKAVDIGAVNSLEQHNKIIRLIEVGIEEGAELWQPENCSCPLNGYFIPPTIFTNVAPTDTIAQEEIFGPVLVCMSFRTPKEAVELANNTRYGLAASVWTENIGKALDVANKIKAGTVWNNCTNLFDAAAGFGGVRESGYGREGGSEGMFEVLKEPALAVDYPEPSNEPMVDSFDEEGERGIDRTYRFLIGGKIARPDGGTSYSIRSPGGTLLGLAGDAGRKDVRNAVEAARGAFESWSNQTAHFRAQILYFLAENVSHQKERLAKGIAQATGRTLSDARWEVERSIEHLFHFAAYADKFGGTLQPVSPKMAVMGKREPIGVMGLRAQDELPLLGLVSAFAPALSMGNTVVLVAGKYALTALDLVQLIQTSDVPSGVLNILSAENPDAVAKVLADHDDVDSVWFFGDKKGGAVVEAASVGNMKRTWVSPPLFLDWRDNKKISQRFLREATQVKNIWVPFGA